MDHDQDKHEVAHSEHDIDRKAIMSGIKAHGRDQDAQECGLEDDDAIGDTDFLEKPACHRITLAPVVIWPHHQIGGMSIQQVEQDKKTQ